MATLRIISIFILIVTLPFAKANESKQAELDRACEIAREIKLTPLKKQFVEECIIKDKEERAYCEQYYSDYGDRAGNRAPLFYDLPECVDAFEYRQRYRQAN